MVLNLLRYHKRQRKNSTQTKTQKKDTETQVFRKKIKRRKINNNENKYRNIQVLL